MYVTFRVQPLSGSVVSILIVLSLLSGCNLYITCAPVCVGGGGNGVQQQCSNQEQAYMCMAVIETYHNQNNIFVN